MRAAPPGCRAPWPNVSVAHSPTPSAVRIAARRVGAVTNAPAACAWWWLVNRIFERRTPRCDEMMPRTRTFSPSEFLMAWGKDRRERGNVRSAVVRMRSNFRMLRRRRRRRRDRQDRDRVLEKAISTPRRMPRLLDGASFVCRYGARKRRRAWYSIEGSS
jgi:hypothetical protein